MPDGPTPAEFPRRTLAALHRALLAWFDAHQRDLPWRRDRDPYRIWVSEVMLQQTTVAAVAPKYERFLAAFPTLAALAAADEQQVLKQWEGLGYYRRARHLHRAAKALAEGHGDVLPDDPVVWAELPGVGRYILGAVLSQAFDRRLPIVEANTLRVISRLYGSREDPRSGPGQKWVWSAAEKLLPDERVGDFNQAMMELGAVVCTPTAPKCDACPAAKWCVARREGLQEVIPPPPRKKPGVEVREVGLVVRDGARLLLVRRPPTATRWAEMWEVPHGEVLDGESEDEAAARIARDLCGMRVTLGPEVATVRHGVTRFAITMTCREATRQRGEFRSAFYTEAAWISADEWKTYPLSTPQRRLFEELTRASRQLRLL